MNEPCTYCGGAWNPSTGAWYSDTRRACGPCVRRFWGWYRTHTAKRKRGPDFYEAALRWRR